LLYRREVNYHSEGVCEYSQEHLPEENLPMVLCAVRPRSGCALRSVWRLQLTFD
jgi:hypothetical protein